MLGLRRSPSKLAAVPSECPSCGCRSFRKAPTPADGLELIAVGEHVQMENALDTMDEIMEQQGDDNSGSRRRAEDRRRNRR